MRKVSLLVPVVLAPWANLHGSVAVAAGLVLLRAAVGLRDPALRARSLALALGGVVASVATPYGVAIGFTPVVTGRNTWPVMFAC